MKRGILCLLIISIGTIFISCGNNKESVSEVKTVENKETQEDKMNEEENKDLEKDKGVNEDIKESSSSTENDGKSDEEESEENMNVTPEQLGSLMSIGNSAVEIFNGGEEYAKEYANTISDYAEKLSGRNVYNIIIPSHIEFILPKKYSDLSASQKENIEVIKNNESDKVKFVDAYSQLKSHKDEYLYFNTDHHWTALGAYYAYCAYAKEGGFQAIDIKSYEAKRKENFLGSFYSSTKDPELANNADYVEYYSVGENCTATLYEDSSLSAPVETTVYAEYAEGIYAYGVFLHGDHPLVKIENTENQSGKKAVIIKESYGNAFAPFLIPHYSEVYVVDLRYFGNKLVDFINDKDIDDVVFINNIFAANTKVHIDKLKEMK